MKTYTKEQLREILEKHRKWLDGKEGGERADLSGGDLSGANLDYACWPLWRGSLDVNVDKRIFAQLAYHLCRVIVDDEECKTAQAALYPIANQFHRVKEFGRLPLNDPPTSGRCGYSDIMIGGGLEHEP